MSVRPELPPMPPRIAALPVQRGYPVPWFAAELEDGTRDFRVMDAAKLPRAERGALCWICGGHMGAYRAYVAGPMCVVNRTSAEPPSHRDCAMWAARACPFLVRPHARRRDSYPDGSAEPDGDMLKRNPGAAVVWVTRGTMRKPIPGHRLYDLGEPVEVHWYAHGRGATREEVQESIDSGLPLLRDVAEQDGPRALRALSRQLEAAMTYLPTQDPQPQGGIS